MNSIVEALDIIVWYTGQGINLKQSFRGILEETIRLLTTCPGDNDDLLNNLLYEYGKIL